MLRFSLLLSICLVLMGWLTGCIDESEDWSTGWRNIVDPITPYPADGRAIAFDSRRQRLVVHGGIELRDTWEFDGRSWHEVTTADTVPAWWSCTACYVPDRDSVFIFGYDSERGMNSLWSYDGESWYEFPVDERISAYRRAAMCYDTDRKRLIVFGGTAESEFGQYTWEWDGLNWFGNITEHFPVREQGHRIVYDAGRHKVVFFGGKWGGVHQDTWEYDGHDWTRLDIANPPPKRWNHALCYDSRSGDVLMFGGYADTSDSVRLGDFWRFDGAAWYQTMSIEDTALVDNPFLAIPAGDDGLWLYSSHEGSLPHDHYTMMHRLDEEGLQPFWVPPAPRPVFQPGLLTFDTTARSLLYVLERDLSTGDDPGVGVWWLGRDGWTPAPSPQNDTTYLYSIKPDELVHDAHRKTTVLIPEQPLTQADDTMFIVFEFHENMWEMRRFADGPRLYAGFSAVYDEKRQRVVLFGGMLPRDNLGNYQYSNDTWEYDGQSWKLITTNRAPSARFNASLGYDSKRGRIMLFGGRLSRYNDTRWTDTWEFDGLTWRMIPTRHAPRHGGSLAFDDHGNRLLYFCHYSSDSYYDGPVETWQFDGEDWEPLAYDHGPTQRSGLAIAVDPIRNSIVLAGGKYDAGGYSTGVLVDAWELRP